MTTSRTARAIATTLAGLRPASMPAGASSPCWAALGNT